jgi:hypothetical protein
MLVIGLIYGVVWWFWLPHHPTPIERATLTAARPASLAARREQPLHRRDHVPYVQTQWILWSGPLILRDRRDEQLVAMGRPEHSLAANCTRTTRIRKAFWKSPRLTPFLSHKPPICTTNMR